MKRKSVMLLPRGKKSAAHLTKLPTRKVRPSLKPPAANWLEEVLPGG